MLRRKLSTFTEQGDLVDQGNLLLKEAGVMKETVLKRGVRTETNTAESATTKNLVQ